MGIMVLSRIFQISRRTRKQRKYYYIAKDHFAHVGAHRKYIDKIEQLKKGVMCTYLLIDIIFI
jgi:hypothetical protein